MEEVTWVEGDLIDSGVGVRRLCLKYVEATTTTTGCASMKSRWHGHHWFVNNFPCLGIFVYLICWDEYVVHEIADHFDSRLILFIYFLFSYFFIKRFFNLTTC